MAEWGTDSEHDRFMRLQEQVRRIKGSGSTPPSQLVKDEAYYRERSEDTDESPKDRALWKQMADELATRLGYNDQSEAQEALEFDSDDDRST